MAGEHVRGAASAPLVLEEFGDFECPYCKQAFRILKSLLSGHEASIRFIYRHFRAREAHPHSGVAAEAAEAAGAQGKFWEFHDLIFSRPGELDGELLAGFAQVLNLDLPRFNKELEANVYRPRVWQDFEAGRSRGLRGTPGFYLNGRFIDTSYGLHHLRDAVRESLARINASPD
jgi:protein-disulfide isomerase